MSTPNFEFMKYGMPLIIADMDYNDFRVEVQDGHYCDVQFIVRTYEDLDFNRESPYCIDNEDAHYYFDECRSKVLRKADAEQRKVYKWLKNLKKEGYTELRCDGVFSNGEAVYSRV